MKIEPAKSIEDADKTTPIFNLSKKFIENNIISIRRMYVNGFIDKPITNSSPLLTKSAIAENQNRVFKNIVTRNRSKISLNQSNNEIRKLSGHPVQAQKNNTKNNSNPKTNEESSLPTLIDDYIFHYRKRKSTPDNDEIDQEGVSDFPKVVKQKSSLNDISPTYSSPQLDILMGDANTLPDYVDKGAVRYIPPTWPGWSGYNSWNNWDDKSRYNSNGNYDTSTPFPCDPTDPNSECYSYECDETDPSSDCYCNIYDPASYCFYNCLDSNSNSPITVRPDQLKQVFYNAPNNLIDSLARSINEYSDMMDITNSNRMAFFLSQAFAEIGDGMTEIEERRSDVNCEQKYGYKTSVGQSMGNKFPGDGMIFKGRGLLNMTGREDYHNFTIWWNKTFPNNPQDFETNPYLVSQNMDVAVLSGLWEFSVKYNGSALKKADSNNLIALTGQINGGQNGANKRSDGLVLARIALCN